MLHLPYHPIMLPALPRDPVIIIRNQIVQQPGFRHHEPRAALDGAQAALGTPAGNGVGCVAGEAGDLLHGQHVGGVGQLLLQVAAEEQAADDLVIEGAGQGYGGCACRCGCRAPARSEAGRAKCGCRCGRLGGSRCGSWDRGRAPAARRSPLPAGLA